VSFIFVILCTNYLHVCRDLYMCREGHWISHIPIKK
jgi:hypothetical protein